MYVVLWKMVSKNVKTCKTTDLDSYKLTEGERQMTHTDTNTRKMVSDQIGTIQSSKH